MNGETVPVQIRIWFRDGGYYDLRGTLDKLETDRNFVPTDFGQHKIYQQTDVKWSLEGTMAAWEFDKSGKPDILVQRAPVARQLAAGSSKLYLGGPDRSKRARRRARSRSRKRHAA